MISWFRRRKPAPPTQVGPELADIAVAHAWCLTLTQWASLSDHERAEARRTVTTAPRFQGAS